MLKRQGVKGPAGASGMQNAQLKSEIWGMGMRCSRAAFARKLRINVRRLEKWEQGRAKPNPQAAALVLLVRKYPDTPERLEKVAAG